MEEMVAKILKPGYVLKGFYEDRVLLHLYQCLSPNNIQSLSRQSIEVTYCYRCWFVCQQDFRKTQKMSPNVHDTWWERVAWARERSMKCWSGSESRCV